MLTEKIIKELVDIIRDNAKVYFENRTINDKSLKCMNDVIEYLEGCMVYEKDQEVFGVLFLDNQHRVLNFDIIATGSLTSVVIPVRKIIQRSFNYNASCIILCHNHLSGLNNPSEEDLNLTAVIHQTCKNLDMRLLDHIIIAKPNKSRSILQEALDRFNISDYTIKKKIDTKKDLPF